MNLNEHIASLEAARKNNPTAWNFTKNPTCLKWCVAIKKNNPRGERNVNHNPVGR